MPKATVGEKQRSNPRHSWSSIYTNFRDRRKQIRQREQIKKRGKEDEAPDPGPKKTDYKLAYIHYYIRAADKGTSGRLNVSEKRLELGELSDQ